MRSTIIGLLVGLTLLGGCKSDAPITPVVTDAHVSVKLDPPQLFPTQPSGTSLSYIALRGHTDGSFVVIRGGSGSPVVEPPLPSGDFCIEVPLKQGATNKLELKALKDGLVSPPLYFEVVQSSSAAKPSNASCEAKPCGENPCPDKETECSDSKDNDLDGYMDNCDYDCSKCQDDVMSPNDLPVSVPPLNAGTYDLKICPCHDDWFAMDLSPGAKVDITATFNTSQLQLDIALYRADDAENAGYQSPSTKPVASSTGISGTESIQWTASNPADGGPSSTTYYLRVYAEGDSTAARNAQGSYRLVRR